jgi:hypothetical protein
LLFHNLVGFHELLNVEANSLPSYPGIFCKISLASFIDLAFYMDSNYSGVTLIISPVLSYNNLSPVLVADFIAELFILIPAWLLREVKAVTPAAKFLKSSTVKSLNFPSVIFFQEASEDSLNAFLAYNAPRTKGANFTNYLPILAAFPAVPNPGISPTMSIPNPVAAFPKSDS